VYNRFITSIQTVHCTG